MLKPELIGLVHSKISILMTSPDEQMNREMRPHVLQKWEWTLNHSVQTQKRTLQLKNVRQKTQMLQK